MGDLEDADVSPYDVRWLPRNGLLVLQIKMYSVTLRDYIWVDVRTEPEVIIDQAK
jgi:hypothetical protein